MTELRKEWREAMKGWWEGRGMDKDIVRNIARRVTTDDAESLALRLQSLADKERREAFESAKIKDWSMGGHRDKYPTYADYLKSKEETK